MDAYNEFLGFCVFELVSLALRHIRASLLLLLRGQIWARRWLSESRSVKETPSLFMKCIWFIGMPSVSF